MNPQDLKINAKITHPDICQFEFSQNIFKDINFVCENLQSASGHWFLEGFFKLTGVKEVSFLNGLLRIRKEGTGPWSELGKAVGNYIRSSLSLGLDLFPPNFFKEKEAQALKKDSELWKKIDTILINQVAPSLSAHGGKVSIVDFKDGILYLNFSGGCQGCSQISATLKGGIETILKKEIAGLKEIVDITDHQSGEKPYFS